MKLNGYIGTITDKEGYLYKNHKTDYKIVIPKNATVIEKKAAEELRNIFLYTFTDISVITDDTLDVSDTGKYIALGDTIYFKSLGVTMLTKEYKYDGFIIETIGDTYVIKGVGGLGTVFGVYSFMERLAGYVYYASDEIKINKEGILKEIHIKEVPTFYGRFAFSHDTRVYQTTGMRMRVNGEFFKWPEFSNDVSPWASLGDQSYALQIMDYTKYAKDHPDWYSFKPRYEIASPPGCYPQICYSKAIKSDAEGGFFDTFMHNLINNYIIPEKDKIFFMLGMTDTRHFCDCEECTKAVAKYKYSGHAMHFVNKVADAVEKWRVENAPEREIYCVAFAYLQLFEAPVYEKDDEFYPIDDTVIARDNVMIQYAPIDANYFYPIMDKEHNPQSYKAIKGWSKITRHFAVWDYRQDFASHAYPYPTYLTAQANLDTYLEYGFIDVFHQAQRFCKNSPFIYVDNFARARMHWDMNEKYDDLWEEGMNAYFKQTKPYVDEYINMLNAYHKVMVSRGHNGKCHDAVTRKYWYHTVDELKAFAVPLNKAMEVAKAEKDINVSVKLQNRIRVLTLFYKLTLIVNFTLDLPKEEMTAMINDVREIAEFSGFNDFQTRMYVEDALVEAEKVLSGELNDNDRVFKKKFGT